MRVLVTGASGMLGGGVARALAARGDDVTVLQRRPSALEGVREHRGDLRDDAAVAEAVRGQDAVVHLAAKVNVVGPWAEYEAINVGGTRSVVAACRDSGVGRLVHISSPSVAHAGHALVGVGAQPADPAGARGPYARSKAMAEQVALAAAEPGRLAVAVLRPHLVWGPGDTQLVARIVERSRRGRLPLLGAGAAMMDTTYVDNAVDAVVAALDRAEVASGEPLVVSNGEPRTISEIIGGFCDAAGVPRPRRHVPVPLALAAGSLVGGAVALRQRLGHDVETDPPLTRFLAEQLSTAHWFDQRRTRELLDWRPRVSLDEGFARLAASYA
ncbi:NAD-dependent epimerase/dehydratase family protein [Auraticoccus monumenti]|uniref:Nucleoside-diphosphate-sugar epimerase n=1 Tax=Auraticoccus monumenti TaxID=675864 RepID=A0A1G6S961_9ACTN|nr:NAD-dependent epimerase/dehydratase family protein [Auraticoccus monumenti]SDD12657.1 Nucleoside-diphosphate-sugar epimerase [Auraticoccus monumenti]